MPRAVLVSAAALAAGAATFTQVAADPLSWLRPCAGLTAGERARVDGGRTVSRIQPGSSNQVSVLAVRRVEADADRLVAWVRRIDKLKAGPLVAAIGVFGDSPQLSDLEGLRLPDEDVDTIRRCRAGDCDIKLTSAEIAVLQGAIGAAGDRWRDAVQAGFRRLVLSRVQAYRRGGLAALDGYADGRSETPLASVGRAIQEQLPCLSQPVELQRYLSGRPDAPPDGLESFLYWSQERMNNRPVVLVTHVVIVRVDQGVVVVGRQVMATHYMNGGLNLTMLFAGGEEGRGYLAVLNRTHVDMLGGIFGGFTRMLVERRLRGDVVGIVDAVAERIQSPIRVQFSSGFNFEPGSISRVDRLAKLNPVRN